MSEMNAAKVVDLTTRMLKMTTRSKMNIGEVASAHYNCLASLALEASGGDKAKAAQLIRQSMELAEHLERPEFRVRVAVRDGKVYPPP